MSIHVTTDIPHGNVADVEITEQAGIPEVRFSAHPHGGTEALWFCFRVTLDGSDASNPVRLTLRHPDMLLGSPRGEHIRPVVRRNGGDWERLGPGTDTELPDGRWTVSWDIEHTTAIPDTASDSPDGMPTTLDATSATVDATSATVDATSTTVDAAFCYPYGRDELHGMLRELGELGEFGAAFRPDRIGVSQSGRPIGRLSNDYGAPDGDRPGIYVTARQHSGETPGSWVMDGLIREMSRAGDSAPLVWVVPFTNIDGVIEGDYGKDPFPWDLNRAWSSPPMRHEVLVIRSDVERWRSRCRPVFALDLHAPGANENEGVYGFVPDPARATVANREVMRWVEPIGEALSEYASPHFAKVARYASRWGTGSMARYFESLGIPALSLETPYARIGDRVLTRDDYREIGARIARAIIDQLKG